MALFWEYLAGTLDASDHLASSAFCLIVLLFVGKSYMDGDVDQQTLIRPLQYFRRENEVSRRADRKKLGNTLHDGENQNMV